MEKNIYIYIKKLDHFGVQQNEHNVNQLHFNTNWSEKSS